MFLIEQVNPDTPVHGSDIREAPAKSSKPKTRAPPPARTEAPVRDIEALTERLVCLLVAHVACCAVPGTWQKDDAFCRWWCAMPSKKITG